MIKNKLNIDTTKFFTAVLISFAVIQIISYLISEFTDYPMLKMGWILLLMLSIIGITSLFVLGKKIGTLDFKKDGLFFILVFVMIILFFIFLPKYLPMVFSSSSLEMGEVIKETLNTIIPMGPGGITPR